MRALIVAGSLALALGACPAVADDANGKFMIKGIGSKTCQDLLRNNGVTREEIREVLLHCAIYAGVPAANSAFHIAEDVFAQMQAPSA